MNGSGMPSRSEPMRRTPIRRAGGSKATGEGAGKPPARLNPQRRRRAAAERAYTVLRREFLAEHPACERCGQRATDVHHRAGRGPNLLRVDLFAALCRPCHDLCGREPAWAVANGYSLSRLAERTAP